MKAVVLGSGGMLGTHLVHQLKLRFVPVLAYSHKAVDVTDINHVWQACQGLDPGDVMINCAGILPGGDPIMTAAVNTVGPHIVADAAAKRSLRVIHISTDCVYGPDTLYGRTKVAGESALPHVTNIRTSFVGPDHGLWAWIEGQPKGAMIEGWKYAFWSGSTVWAVAHEIARLTEEGVQTGIVHLATERPITKLDVVNLLAAHLHREDLTIVPTDVSIYRAMVPDVVLPPFFSSLLAGSSPL